ncbi:AraC family transcriptional regulator [Mesorhizobium sp. BR1-1-9]|uniref:helix-turn-helix transcriptional regulator n=1 Tax=Mesorhizobium sp. BR1-1-9 TaxID=2876646 RepID=UPI001CD045DB|nr:AraC family transcriptional regulator [Mesorhizobium sp. BR1-1-9]MBZ9874316.1 AraC family transcriptional regulator [Mesorhizobium sp. BR1-1-9]
MADQDTIIVLSTDAIAAREREAAVREFYGRICMRLDLAPLERGELRLSASTIILPGVSVAHGQVAPMAWERTAALQQDANDDVVVSWIAGGWRFDTARHEAVETSPGAPCIMPMDRSWRARAQNGDWTICARFARSTLTPLLRHVGDLRPDAINPGTPEARLLLAYIEAVARGAISPGLAPLAAQHIADLFAAAVGANREVDKVVAGRGVRAARMHAIKRYIEENLHRARLSAETAGRGLGLSPRYIRRLFAEEGQGFSDYVMQRRLERVHRQLASPLFSARPIADLAFEAGLVEPSTFYRQFRSRYRMTPSEVRAGRAP